MSRYEGLIIKTDLGTLMLICKTKKIDSLQDYYIHNITDNYFVSTLFIKKETDKYIQFNFNDFDLISKKQIYYLLEINKDTYEYKLSIIRYKRIDNILVSLEYDKRIMKKRLRRYSEIK